MLLLSSIRSVTETILSERFVWLLHAGRRRGVSILTYMCYMLLYVHTFRHMRYSYAAARGIYFRYHITLWNTFNLHVFLTSIPGEIQEKRLSKCPPWSMGSKAGDSTPWSNWLKTVAQRAMWQSELHSASSDISHAAFANLSAYEKIKDSF